jgi:serine/threonine protein kinase
MMMEQHLGEYRLINIIATGGMGQLYLASRSGPEGVTKIAAVKCILPELAGTPHFRRMFFNEARLAAQLDHPNIVSTFELGEANGSYFIAMEYLPGEDLAAICNRTKQLGRRMPIDIAVAIASACADGLEFAHELPLVHRDVNPANVLVTYHGAVKLLDFGIAKVRESSVREGVFQGKLRYASPEQVEGGTIDRRTDVFCLGAVLWECLTGTALFDGSAQAQIVEAVRSKPIVAPSQLRSEIPRELDRIVLKALDRSPARRHQSARELGAELARLSHSQPRIVEWLESLFGQERAAWKIGIARGQRLEQPLRKMLRTHVQRPDGDASVTTTAGFKRAWTSDLPGHHTGSIHPFVTTPPPVPRGRHQPLLWIALPILVLSLGGAVVALQRTDEEQQVAVRASYSLEVTSTPPGAQIYLEGQPTGRKTPAVIEELASDGSVSVVVVMEAYQSMEKKCVPEETCSFTLKREGE